MPRAGTIVRYAVLLLALLICGYPLVWMLFTAVRQEGAILANPFGLPLTPTLESMRLVLQTGGFLRAYANSLLVCTAAVAASTLGAAAAAFALARLPLRGRGAFLLLFVIGMMIPIHVTLVPLNRMLGAGGLGWKQSLWVLLGPYVGFSLPISLLILRNAFLRLPDELFEAARMDGCGHWRLFLSIALPLVRPALATVVIFNALTLWNEFAFALTLIADQQDRTLPLALWQFQGEHGMFLAQTCAALCVAVVPLLLVYTFAQDHIIRGLTAGATKG